MDATTLAYRGRNVEKHLRTTALYRADNWKQRLIYNARWRAKTRGLEFNLSVDALHWPTHCPVLGIELVTGSMDNPDGKNNGPRDNSPTLDRMDNSRGYTIDNVMVMSFMANRLKSDATAAQLMAVARFVAEQEKKRSN